MSGELSAGRIGLEGESDREDVHPEGPESGSTAPTGMLGGILSDRRGAGAAAVLLIVLVAAIGGQWLAPYDPFAIDSERLLEGPSAAHWFGTDELGRDVLSRVLVGSRATVLVVLVGVGAALILGTLLGLVSGYRGGFVDSLIMRVVDGLLAFPMLVLALAVVAALGPGLRNALIAVAVVNVPRFARVVRGQVLSLRTREYVLAAQIVGVPTHTILRRHVLPHLAGVLIVFSAIAAATAIVAEASLAFLGLSAQPPDPSWGGMVALGVPRLEQSWSMSVFPGMAVALTVGALNLLADCLRDHLDIQAGIDRR